MENDRIPFNRPFLTGKEMEYVAQAQAMGQLAGDGHFTKTCHAWLESLTGSPSLLTHSCTAALEMSALLLDIGPGDEIIMPSYTFVSTANAFVLRGGVPVFVDIRSDTLNLDETLIEQAISPRTRAIVAVHYAGVPCEMDTILAIAKRHGLKVIEDAAQGMMSTYKGRELGSLGDLGTFSFHETKNIISGEGGALVVNDPQMVARAEIIREKGTDRSRFFRGEVDKYSWQEVGSSFLPGELIGAFLWAQLEHATEITAARVASWEVYHKLLELAEQAGQLRRPTVPDSCTHNGHLYYVILPEQVSRADIIAGLNAHGISSVFHYVPLHDSPAGLKYARTASPMTVTNDAGANLLRLPLWQGIDVESQQRVVNVLGGLIS